MLRCARSSHDHAAHAGPPFRRRFGEEEVGFRYIASGPLVRSSYRAGEFFVEAMIKQDRRYKPPSRAVQADGAHQQQQGGKVSPFAADGGGQQVVVAGVALQVPEL